MGGRVTRQDGSLDLFPLGAFGGVVLGGGVLVGDLVKVVFYKKIRREQFSSMVASEGDILKNCPYLMGYSRRRCCLQPLCP